VGVSESSGLVSKGSWSIVGWRRRNREEEEEIGKKKKRRKKGFFIKPR